MRIEEQVKELTRGLVELISSDGLVAKLAESRPLRIKAGFDPTAPDIHIGHTVLLQALRRFQQLGHQVIFLIGDYTAMIGDPSGRNKTRPMLSKADVEHNAETYKEQVFKILDPEKTEVRFNSEWFDKMSLAEAIERFASRYTVARMLERDDFETRFRENRPIAIHEFIYPLVQGYDSVALEADVEMGGTDQKFNLLLGRDLQRSSGNVPQVVMTVPLLEGLDGVMKMSKSYGNYVGIAEAPLEQFGKLMSISDTLMWRYYELLSDLSLEEIESRKQMVGKGELHPRKAKALLAKEIVSRFHGPAEADEAEAEFDRIHSRHDLPTEIEVQELPRPSDGIILLDLLLLLGMIGSKSEGRRLAQQNGIRVDGKKVQEVLGPVDTASELLIQVGKRKFRRVRFVDCAE